MSEMDRKMIRAVLWAGLVSTFVLVTLHLVGCAPRYVNDDPAIFGRQEVLERIAR